jgi:hypothetical protein
MRVEIYQMADRVLSKRGVLSKPVMRLFCYCENENLPSTGVFLLSTQHSQNSYIYFVQSGLCIFYIEIRSVLSDELKTLKVIARVVQTAPSAPPHHW